MGRFQQPQQTDKIVILFTLGYFIFEGVKTTSQSEMVWDKNLLLSKKKNEKDIGESVVKSHDQ